MQTRFMMALFVVLLVLSTALIALAWPPGGDCPPWTCGVNGPALTGTRLEMRLHAR